MRQIPVWPVYVVGAVYATFLLYLAATGGLGVEPINALERELGKLVLKLLVFGLAITPMRRLAGLNLLRFRRAVGLLAFFYAVLHLLVWLVLDVQIPSQIWADILKRPYITVGMAGFLLLLPLAATSNDFSLRRLGGVTWRRLHRLVYPAALLGVVHYIMLVKGFPYDPLLYLFGVLSLLGMRFRLARLRRLVGSRGRRGSVPECESAKRAL